VTAPHCGQRENIAVGEGEVNTRLSRLLSYQIDSRKILAHENAARWKLSDENVTHTFVRFCDHAEMLGPLWVDWCDCAS